MNGYRIRKAAGIAAAVGMLLLALPPFALADSDPAADAASPDAVSGSYREYLSRYPSAVRGGDRVELDASCVETDADAEVMAGFEGYDRDCLLIREGGGVTFRFAVSEAGLYRFRMEYYPVEGKGSAILCSFLVDGETPYNEMKELAFPRTWINDGPTRQDAGGNDIRPTQIEAPRWTTAPLQDARGYYTEPLAVYLEAGEHRLTLQSEREPVAVGRILAEGGQPLKSYEEQRAAYRAAGLTDAADYYEEYQGEAAAYKSDASLYPIYDRSSPDTVPSSAASILLNTIGGDKWQSAGQWLAWVVEVPRDGLYTLGIRGRQNIINGAYSCRRLLVNGEVPFAQAEEIRFAYDNGWSTLILGGGEAYRIPLKAGKNEIRLEVVLGELAGLLTEVDDCMLRLNEIYMQILMITGPAPDKNRDYQFQKQIPETLESLAAQGARLNDLYERYVAVTGQNGQQAQTLKKAARLIEAMTQNPHTIANRYAQFASNITDIGTWLTTAAQQPLEIDYLVVASPDRPIDSPRSGFFETVWFGIRQLAATFFHDYDVVGERAAEKRNVTVWVGNGATGGRDQAQVLQRMVSADFSDSDIAVQVQLVSMGALLPATLSGKGPDVALTMNASDPVNYAIRNGVVDLASLSGYAEVAGRFLPSALEPFSFGGGVYALPETQTFYMLFYREDILSELGVAVPQTWGDVTELLPVLQKKNLNFGMPPVLGEAVGIGYNAYAMLLFQKGGALYNESGSLSRLNSPEAVDAFYQWTKLYTDYGLPTQYDFINRFRSGAVPIGIADYSTYNTLQVFAPEIKGMWQFAPVPGTQTDGGIDRSTCGTTTGCILLSSARDRDAAWEFLKWWTSGDVQGDFGLELESILGAAGRYSPANLEALERIPWSNKNLAVIREQLAQVRGIREVPGSYMSSRFVDFAFRDVINSAADPDEAVRDAVRQINAEIKLRRKEFKLPD